MIGPALLLLALGWLYGRTLSGLVAEWASSPDASYGLVLAAVAGWLLWTRRRAFAAAIDSHAPRLAALAAVLFALFVFVVGQLGADLFLTRASFVMLAAASLWFLVGARAVRTIAAPLAFLAIAVPLPALVVNAITLPLQLVASRIAESSLMAVGVPVFRDGNVLTLPSATLEVAEACSGLRSLISLVAIAILLAWLAETGIVRRAAIVALAIPVAIVMNGWRVAATGIACETFGPRAASGGWHTFTGWVTFVVSVGALALIERAVGDRRAVVERPGSAEPRASAERVPA